MKIIESSTECPVFDFTKENKDGIDDIITEKINILRVQVWVFKKNISRIRGQSPCSCGDFLDNKK